MPTIDRFWRRFFLVEIPICFATGAYWLVAPGHYVQQTYGVAAPDAAHEGLTRQLAFVLLTVLVWTYGRWLASGRVELRPFRLLQEGLALGDVLIIAGAAHAASTSAMSPAMALAQSAPAAFWLAVRVVFLVRTQTAPAREGERELSS
jgi:hypothetical protein